MKKFEVTLELSDDLAGQNFTLNLARTKLESTLNSADKLHIIASYLRILEVDRKNRTILVASFADNEDEDTITELMRQFMNEDIINPLVTISVLSLEFEDTDPTVSSATMV